MVLIACYGRNSKLGYEQAALGVFICDEGLWA
jgi:hypothetical protein